MEIYETEAAFEAHRAAPHMAANRPRIGEPRRVQRSAVDANQEVSAIDQHQELLRVEFLPIVGQVANPPVHHPGNSLVPIEQY
jgi:hypothetical protein